MAEQSQRRDSRSEHHEQISIDRGPPSRGRSERRRPPRPYVRPAAEDADDNDDYDDLPHPRPPSIHHLTPQPRQIHIERVPRTYGPIYRSEAPYGQARTRERYRRYSDDNYPRRAEQELPIYVSDRRPRARFPVPWPVHGMPGGNYLPGPDYPRESIPIIFERRNPPSPTGPQEGTRRRRSRRRHHSIETNEVEDQDGNHYDRPSSLSRREAGREAEPTSANQQVTTSSYYDGSGEKAWRRKNQERSGFGPPPELLIDPDEPAPRNCGILCFVTVRGQPIFANAKAPYRTESTDEDFAIFLKQEYKDIIAKARWLPLRLFHLKTIGAIEFQTWAMTRTFKGNKWYLAEVDCIPEIVNRASMSHFSYQLRHPFTRVRRWTTKVETLLQAADQVHSRGRNGVKWNFRIHIIEMLDARSIYFALACVVVPSAAGGLVYGGLTGDFSTGFTIASYVLAAFALLLALVAVTEFLGMESPDSFAANGVYAKGLEMYDPHFDPIRPYYIPEPPLRRRFDTRTSPRPRERY